MKPAFSPIQVVQVARDGCRVHSLFRRVLDQDTKSILTSYTDVSNLRRPKNMAKVRDPALAAVKAKDQFIAALSHELKTPLNPVLLLASEGAKDETLPPRAREMFELIIKNVAMEARLIDDLLDVSRITYGKWLSKLIMPTSTK